MDWMDFNHDGKIDGAEFMMGEEMLCSSRKEHELLFGDSENYDGDDYEDEEQVNGRGECNICKISVMHPLLIFII